MGPTGQDQRHGSSRHVRCLFKITAMVKEKTCDPWFPEIINNTYCHGSTKPGAHPVLWRMAMTFNVRSEIIQQLATQVAPSQVLFFFAN